MNGVLPIQRRRPRFLLIPLVQSLETLSLPTLKAVGSSVGLDNLVSKHRDRPYQGGRSKHWISNAVTHSDALANEGVVRMDSTSYGKLRHCASLRHEPH